MDPKERDREIDAALFLLKEKVAEEQGLAARGITLESIAHDVRTIRRTLEHVSTEIIAIGLRTDRYRRELGARVDLLEETASANGGGGRDSGGVGGRDRDRERRSESETTGVHRAEELQIAKELVALRAQVQEQEKHHAAARDSVTYWRRFRVQIVAGVLASLFVTACVSAAGYLGSRIALHQAKQP